MQYCSVMVFSWGHYTSPDSTIGKLFPWKKKVISHSGYKRKKAGKFVCSYIAKRRHIDSKR